MCVPGDAVSILLASYKNTCASVTEIADGVDRVDDDLSAVVGEAFDEPRKVFQDIDCKFDILFGQLVRQARQHDQSHRDVNSIV